MHHAVVVAFLLVGLNWATGTGASAQAPQVRLTTHTVVVDREAAHRAGVSYVTLADGRVEVRGVPARRRGATVAVQGPLGIRAFLDLARERRWTRSESTQMVLVRSGSEGGVSSLEGTVGTYGERARGPTIRVRPTVLPDGRVELELAGGIQDRRESGWGYGVDASPAWVETVVVVRDREPATVASSSTVQSTVRSGLLRIGSSERGTDVLIVVTPEIVW